jgi:hypothetical protein
MWHLYRKEKFTQDYGGEKLKTKKKICIYRL